MRNKIIATVIGLIIILFIFLVSDQFEKINYKLDELRMYQSEVESIRSSIDSISVEMDMRLNEFLQEQLWIQEKGLHIVGIDTEKNNANVKIEWTLRDLLAKEHMSLLYRKVNEKEWAELETSSVGGLNYTLEHTFSIKDNYELQILATSAEGQRSEKLIDLNLEEMINSRVTIDAQIHATVSNQYDLIVYIYNNMEMAMEDYMLADDLKSLEIKSAKAFVYADGEVYEEIDLLEENTGYKNEQYYEYFGDVTLEGAKNVELRVVVEDEYGWKYETTQKPW